MKIFYDKERVIEDLDFESLLSELNIPTKRKGRYVYALCPKHNDTNFGSAYVLQGMYRGSARKGIFCHACNQYISAISLVEDAYNLNYTETLEFLANRNSSMPEDYISDISFSSKEEEEAYYSASKIDKKIEPIKVQKKKKAPISKEDLKLLDLCPEEAEHNNRDYGYLSHNYKILDALDRKPDDKVTYIEHSYWNKNEGEDLINVEYLVFEKTKSKDKFDLDYLYATDIEAYKFVILSKAYTKKDNIERLLENVKYATSEELVMVRDALKLYLCKVNQIIEFHLGLEEQDGVDDTNKNVNNNVTDVA